MEGFKGRECRMELVSVEGTRCRSVLGCTGSMGLLINSHSELRSVTPNYHIVHLRISIRAYSVCHSAYVILMLLKLSLNNVNYLKYFKANMM